MYPKVYRGQGYQISDPNRDGLVANSPSPNPVSDLDGRAIRFEFDRPVRAVGLFFNGPLQGGDGGYLKVFDSATNLIGQSDTSSDQRWHDLHHLHQRPAVRPPVLSAASALRIDLSRFHEHPARSRE